MKILAAMDYHFTVVINNREVLMVIAFHFNDKNFSYFSSYNI